MKRRAIRAWYWRAMASTIVAAGFLGYGTVEADGPPVQWEKTLGGRLDDYGLSVQQTSDGGFIIGGEICSFGPAIGNVQVTEPALIIDGTQLELCGRHSFTEVKVINGGILKVTPYNPSLFGTGVVYLEAESIFVDETSAIVADRTGYNPALGDGGRGQGGQGGPYADAGGGGYGGKGASTYGGMPYGDNSSPDVNMGSGGGNLRWVYDTSYGGPGGGAIILQAKVVSIEGRVSATGASGQIYGGFEAGAGSGGGILVFGDEVLIRGSLDASGGNANFTGPIGGCGGGGGRIKVFATCRLDTTSSQIQCSGGAGEGRVYGSRWPSESGTIFVSLAEPKVDLSIRHMDVSAHNIDTDSVFILANVTNNGPITATNLYVRFYDDSAELIDESYWDHLDPCQTAPISVTWTGLRSWEENRTLRAEVRCDEEDSDPNNNEYEIQVSVYYANLAPNQPAYKPFQPQQDGYNFPNWPMLEVDWRDILANAIARMYPPGLWRDFIYTIQISIIPSITWQVGGYCYGMASTSIAYYKYPELKPIQIPTYDMNKTDSSVINNINNYQITQIPHLLEGLSLESYLYQPFSEYNNVLQTIKDDSEPIMLLIFQALASHAVTAYQIIDVKDPRFPQDPFKTRKKIICYDNNRPRMGVHYASFLPAGWFSNEAGQYMAYLARHPLYDFDKDLARHWLTKLITRKIDELWSTANKLVAVRCPAETLIVSEGGERIGYVDGKEINEIPGATVFQFCDEEFFTLPMDLSYTVTITGLATGEADVSVLIPTGLNMVSQYSYEGMPLEDDSTIRFISSPNEPAGEATTSFGETYEPNEVSVTISGDTDCARRLRSDFNHNGRVDFFDFATIANRWLRSCSDPNWCEGTDLTYNEWVAFSDLAIFVESWLWEKMRADLDYDCDVNFSDYTLLANQWLGTPGVPSADIAPDAGDGIVDFWDLAMIAEYWLEGATP